MAGCHWHRRAKLESELKLFDCHFIGTLIGQLIDTLINQLICQLIGQLIGQVIGN